MDSAIAVPVGIGGKYPCEHPQLFVDLTTGEPGWSRCHATRHDVCPGCAAQYRDDVKQLLRSGMMQRLEKGEPVGLVTFTAPGLWLPDADQQARYTHRFHPEYWELIRLIRRGKRVSRRRLGQAASNAVCPYCTQQARANRPPGTRVSDVPAVRHGPDDPLAGLPVDLDAFDYQAAAWWHWNLGDLWHRTVTYARRTIDADLQFAKIVEMQRRGVAHVHALSDPPISPHQLQELIAAVNASLPPGRLGWGEQSNTQRLSPGDPGTPRTVGQLTAYLAKYLTKNTAGGITNSASDHPHAAYHLRRLRAAAHTVAVANAKLRPGGPCPHCPEGTLTAIDSSWLACPRCGWEGRTRINRYQADLAVRAQRFTKSRRWATEQRQSHTRPGTWLPVVSKNGEPRPLLLRTLRQRRRQWAQRNTPPPQQPRHWARLRTLNPTASPGAPNPPP